MLTVLTLLAASALTPATGEEVIRSMHARYAGRWYQNLTFVQRTTYYDPGTSDIDSARIWYESLSLGGRLRIDIAPLADGNGLVFRNDSLYSFRAGEVVGRRPLLHPLLILGFDVYSFPVEETIAKLSGLGFDLDKSYETRWQGRDVYVVGAESPEDRSGQFWIDRERLVFVRMLQYAPNGTEFEVQFNAYEPLGEGWISPEVVFMANGSVTLVEEYADYRIDIPLGPEVFAIEDRPPLSWVEN